MVANPPRRRTFSSREPPAWVPNWREPSQYPEITNTPLLRWSWEFLRRNSDYWNDFDVARHWPPPPGGVKPLTLELDEKLKAVERDANMSNQEREEWQRWSELQGEHIAKVGALA